MNEIRKTRYLGYLGKHRLIEGKGPDKFWCFIISEGKRYQYESMGQLAKRIGTKKSITSFQLKKWEYWGYIKWDRKAKTIEVLEIPNVEIVKLKSPEIREKNRLANREREERRREQWREMYDTSELFHMVMSPKKYILREDGQVTCGGKIVNEGFLK